MEEKNGTGAKNASVQKEEKNLPQENGGDFKEKKTGGKFDGVLKIGTFWRSSRDRYQKGFAKKEEAIEHHKNL